MGRHPNVLRLNYVHSKVRKNLKYDTAYVISNQDIPKQQVRGHSNLHCKDKIPKIRKNIPRKELRGHSPNFHIHVSVGDLYFPTIGLPILLQDRS